MFMNRRQVIQTAEHRAGFCARHFLALLLTGTLAILAAAWFVCSYRSPRREETQIRIRYQQMRLALASADTNAAKALYAPEFREGAHRSLGLLGTFAKPLGPQSSVKFWASKAQICPERIYHYRVLPGGHTIEMVKADDQWFFTGNVHVD
ncbi:MAG: hypothetical protein KIT22_11875 [Verrucomicrobiae bacterium]|nr:hypothetical protein [Verrucomicrobiae bacterium]